MAIYVEHFWRYLFHPRILYNQSRSNSLFKKTIHDVTDYFEGFSLLLMGNGVQLLRNLYCKRNLYRIPNVVFNAQWMSLVTITPRHRILWDLNMMSDKKWPAIHYYRNGPNKRLVGIQHLADFSLGGDGGSFVANIQWNPDEHLENDWWLVFHFKRR